MGYHKEQKSKGAGRKQTNGGGITRLWNYQNEKEPHDTADWARCDSEAIGTLIALVGSFGGAVLFGYSRDRGAYRIIVMDDDGKFTEWIPCSTDVTEALWAIVGKVQDALVNGQLDAPEGG